MIYSTVSAFTRTLMAANTKAHLRMICSTGRGAIAMPMATAMSAGSKTICLTGKAPLEREMEKYIKVFGKPVNS